LAAAVVVAVDLAVVVQAVAAQAAVVPEAVVPEAVVLAAAVPVQVGFHQRHRCHCLRPSLTNRQMPIVPTGTRNLLIVICVA